MKKITYTLLVLVFAFMLSPSKTMGQVPYNPAYALKSTGPEKYADLYKFLKKEGYPFSMLGTIQEFTAKIKIESHARRLYEGLRKDGYSESVLGTEEQFVKKYCK